jgi:hypothetical protein
LVTHRIAENEWRLVTEIGKRGINKKKFSCQRAKQNVVADFERT